MIHDACACACACALPGALCCVWANISYRLTLAFVPVRVLMLRPKSISGVAAHVLPAKLDAAASVADRSDIVLHGSCCSLGR